jgi:curved DNA-binding protein CbpA
MDPYAVLRVAPDATPEEIRQAWLAGIRRSPPDRDPEAFGKLREAYDFLRDPLRARSERLFGAPNVTSLSDLAEKLPGEKKWVGPAAWLRLLGEGRP